MLHAYKRALRGASVLALLLAGAAGTAQAQWAELPGFSQPIIGSESVIVGGKLYMFGGATGDDPLLAGGTPLATGGSLDLANPTAWTPTGKLPKSNFGGYAVQVKDKIDIIGGFTISGSSLAFNTGIYEFDPATNTFSTTSFSKLGPNVTSGYAATLNGKSYLLGGVTTNPAGQLVYTEASYSYDLTAKTWEKVGDLPFIGGYGGAAAVGSNLYVFGGTQIVGDNRDDWSTAAWKGTVNGTSIDWVQVADMPAGLRQMATGVLDGKIYLAGGDETSYGTNGKTYIYDPAKDSWTVSYELPVETALSAPLASDGTSLYLIGGIDNNKTYKLTVGAPKPVVYVDHMNVALTVEKGSTSNASIQIANKGIIDLNGTIEIQESAKSWLSVTPPSIALQPGANADLTFTGSGASQAPGNYKTVVNVKSNDPNKPSLAVTVYLFVVDKLVKQPTRVVVEEATGNWCGWCPYGHEVLEAIVAANPDNAVILSYHGPSGEPMRIAEGEALLNKLGNTGYPSAAVQRWNFLKQKSQMVGRDKWEEYVATVLEQKPNAPVKMEISGLTYNPVNRKFGAKVTMTTSEGMPLPEGASLHMTAVITEDSVEGYPQHLYTVQPDGSVTQSDIDPYYHMDVVRFMYPNSNGMELTIPSGALNEDKFLTPNTMIEQEVSFTAPSTAAEHAYITFLVHRFENNKLGEILQAVRMPLMQPEGGVDNQDVVTGSGMTLSSNVPNPTATTTQFSYNIAKAGIVTAELFSVTGEKVFSFGAQQMEAGAHMLNVDATKLPVGMYWLRVTSNGTTLSHAMTVAR